MSRRLAGATLAEAARPLAAPDPADDPFVADVVARARAEAHAAGLAEGRRAAVAEAEAAAAAVTARAVDALEQAVGDLRDELRAHRESRASTAVALARRIAEAVVGREPHDDGVALLARCRSALAALDDEGLEVRCHPEDREVLVGGLAGDHAVSVVADGSLAPGEARVRGPWSSAELTREIAWAQIGAALTDEEAGRDG